MTREKSIPVGPGRLNHQHGAYGHDWMLPDAPDVSSAEVESACQVIDRHAHDERDAAELRRMLGIGVQS